MSGQRVDAAVGEAKRFLKAVDALKERCKSDQYAMDSSRESGAVRRASLDLTRALADMRRSQ
jgi:hypothetical protein